MLGFFYFIGKWCRRAFSNKVKTLREDRRGAEEQDVALQSRLAQEFKIELFGLYKYENYERGGRSILEHKTQKEEMFD